MSDGLSDALGGSYFGGRKSKFFQYRITNDYIIFMNLYLHYILQKQKNHHDIPKQFYK